MGGHLLGMHLEEGCFPRAKARAARSCFSAMVRALGGAPKKDALVTISTLLEKQHQQPCPGRRTGALPHATGRQTCGGKDSP